jgi:hypothetical protein
MDEQKKMDESTKQIVANNLTAAYFATVEKQTRRPEPDATERLHIYNEILRVY